MLVSSMLKRFCDPVLGLFFLSLLTLSTAQADEMPATAAQNPFKFSGFATLGTTHNNNKAVGAITSYSQKNSADNGVSANLDSVLGVQMDWQVMNNTSLVLQGVARVGNDLEPELRMGYVRQQLGNELAVRIGRIRSPMYFDSDVAEIGYAYLMSRPPLPLYGTVNSVSALNGLDVQWRHTLGNAAVLVQGYYGDYKYKQWFYNLSPMEVADAELEDIRGLAVTLALPNATVRASRTWINSYTLRSSAISQLNTGLTQISSTLREMSAIPGLGGLAAQSAQIAGYRNPYDNRPIYTSIGFDGNVDAWRLMGEWTRLDSRSTMVGIYEGLHLAVGYSLGEFTPYVSAARQQRKGPGLDTSALVATGINPQLDAGMAQMKAGLEQAARFANISTSSTSVGVRWDFRESMAMKVQYDRLWTPNSTTPGIFAVSQLPFNHKVNLLTVALDVIF